MLKQTVLGENYWIEILHDNHQKAATFTLCHLSFTEKYTTTNSFH